MSWRLDVLVVTIVVCCRKMQYLQATLLWDFLVLKIRQRVVVVSFVGGG